MMQQQNTMQWHLDRCGKFTASRVGDILAVQEDKWKVIRPTGTTAKVCSSQEAAEEALLQCISKAKGQQEAWHVKYFPGEPLLGFKDYVDEVLCERLTGEPDLGPETYQMAWGKEHEPHAIDAFEIKTGATVQPCGFIDAVAPGLAGVFGASPDGLVDKGLVADVDLAAEVKCPIRPRRHLRCFYQGVPEEHMAQIQGQMLATGRSATVFISYDPRMPRHLQLFWKVVPIDATWQHRISLGVLRAENALNELMTQLPKEETE